MASSSPLLAALIGGDTNASALGVDPAAASAMNNLQLAQAMQQGAMSTSAAYPAQAIARLGQALAGNYIQGNATSQLANLYAHTAESAASTLPEGHPLLKALNSPDPVIRMQGLQAYQSALKLLSQPENVAPGHQVFFPGSGNPVSQNTRARTELGMTKEDMDAAEAAAGRGAQPARVPLNPPRLGYQGGMGDNGEEIIGAGPAQPRQVQTTTYRSLQPAIDLKAREAAATEAAKNPALVQRAGQTAAAENPALIARAGAEEAAKNPALVQRAGQTAAAENPALIERAGGTETAKNTANYGPLLTPSPAPAPGPGGTEPLPTQHGTKIPPLTDQAPIPTNPEELKQRLPAWQKTSQDWNTSLQPSYQAEQRLNTIANAFKQIQTGAFTTNKAQFATWLKSAGLDSVADKVMQGADPSQVQLALHENYAETMQQLKAATSRFTQQEFKITAENKEHPNLQPEANLQMLAEDIGALRQARDLPRDFVIAQQHGWKDPQSYEQAWLRQNPLSGYVDTAKKEIGPLKGMTPESVTGGNKQGAPPVGYVHDGWTFKGGDPNKKESWAPPAASFNDRFGGTK